MSNLIMRAPAKINLGLEIIGRRYDGYHNLKTVFCQISLYDTVEITEILENEIKINCDYPGVPTNKENTVYKAALLLKDKFRITKGVVINIEKKIPVEAGLGGGSSDAAATLFGLNKLWNLGLAAGELIEIAVKIGADVPYPIVGGTKLATGVGEIFERLPSVAGMDLVVCVPDAGVSTKWAFENVLYDKISKGKIDGLIEAINKKNILKIAENLHNDFEYWVLEKYPEIARVRQKMIDYGVLGALMTGSGSGVFGICKNRRQTEEVCKRLKRDFEKTFVARTI